MNEELQTILGQFELGTVREIRPIASGLINASYFVEASSGDYILQRLGDVFNEETVQDMAKVTVHLTAKQVTTPSLISTTSGSIYTKDDVGHVWRIMTAMAGETFDTLETVQLAQEAGRVLAEFHLGMQDFDARQLNSPLKLHQTEDVLRAFMDVYDTLMEQERDDALKSAYAYIAKELPETLLPSGLPTTIIHGDPKISNIIFKEGAGVCMIDLDTCMEHSALVDLGDALWSWCGLEGDNPENRFSLHKFEAAMQGYMGVIPLSSDEQHYVYRAARMIALELASRFARDIIDDSYFGWDADRYPSRKAHNRARVLAMVNLEHDIVNKKDRIIDILNTI